MGAYENWMKQREQQGLVTEFDTLYEMAKSGDVGAQVAVGVMYARGWHVEQDLESACALWHQAAERGNIFAQYNLAAMYEHGFGVPQNTLQAISLYQRAAAHGCSMAEQKVEALIRSTFVAPMPQVVTCPSTLQR